MNCPGHAALYADGAVQLPRAAAADGRGGRAPPQRAHRRAPRPAARAHVLAGRRAHLLHARADRGRGARLPRVRLRDLRAARAARSRSSSRPGPRTSSAPTRSGTWPRRRSREALATKGIEYVVNEGDGAFYGPKIDLHMLDSLDRSWQIGTVQLDFQMPQRFGLRYQGADNAEHTPVMIHRALIGSFERFIGILIEHFAGAFPFWLAPVQVRILPVGLGHHDAAHALAATARRLPRRGRRLRRDRRQADPQRRGRRRSRSRSSTATRNRTRRSRSASTAAASRRGRSPSCSRNSLPCRPDK